MTDEDHAEFFPKLQTVLEEIDSDTARFVSLVKATRTKEGDPIEARWLYDATSVLGYLFTTWVSGATIRVEADGQHYVLKGRNND